MTFIAPLTHMYLTHRHRVATGAQEGAMQNLVRAVDEIIGESSFGAAGLNDIALTPVQLGFVCKAIADDLPALRRGANLRTEAESRLDAVDPHRELLNPTLYAVISGYISQMHDAEALLANLPGSGSCGQLPPGHAVDVTVIGQWREAIDAARSFAAGWSAVIKPYGLTPRDFVHV